VIILFSPYAGNIRILEAVNIPELNCLQSVLVFSTEGDRMSRTDILLQNRKNCFVLGPDFHKISGSDLDGDHYFVSVGFSSFFLSIINIFSSVDILGQRITASTNS